MSDCEVEGCNGGFGPGCITPPFRGNSSETNPLYFRCKHNKDLLDRIWNGVDMGKKPKIKPEPIDIQGTTDD